MIDRYGKDLINLAKESPMYNRVDYKMKVINNILSNKEKVDKWLNNKSITPPSVFWEKLQKDLQIPRPQVDLLAASEGNTFDEKLANFIANYSYTIEINTSISKSSLNVEDSESLAEEMMETGQKRGFENRRKNTPTQYYSNLTVPGGTNYTENEIATPLITPSIKGHAQFATDKGIGWFRSDDMIDEEASGFNALAYKNNPNQIFEPISGDSKTRRILEVQSDLFQKGRDKEFLVDNYKHTPGDRNFNVTYEGKEYKVGTMGGMQRVVIYKTLEGQVHYENPKQDWLTQEEIPQGLKDIVSNKFNSLKQEVLTQ